ncbi:Acetylxylan esterase 2 like protein [Verticillium longisporum]|nr:Acetylxylan esterase 2 like protein [Verticillium longisporum]
MKTTAPLVALAAASTAAAQNTTVSCSKGVHLLVSRGSAEDPGPGRLGPLADDIVAAIPGSAIESIVYPATFDDYGLSVADGAEALTAALDRYSDACPNGKVVLLGYSQGAHVTLDALCGREESTGAFAFNETTPIPESIVDKSVIAVILYGDPTHIPLHQLFGRDDTAACEPYAPKIASWCDTGDVYCDRGNNTEIHGGYFALYDDDAVDFVVDRWNATLEEEAEAAASGTSGAPSQPTETGAAGGNNESAAVGVRAGWGALAVAAMVGYLAL